MLPMPYMSSLKESGDIEYSADIILGFSTPKELEEHDNGKLVTYKQLNLHLVKGREILYSNRGRIGAEYRLIYPYYLFQEVKDVDTSSLNKEQINQSFKGKGRNEKKTITQH